jgi:hypothetical protein
MNALVLALGLFTFSNHPATIEVQREGAMTFVTVENGGFTDQVTIIHRPGGFTVGTRQEERKTFLVPEPPPVIIDTLPLQWLLQQDPFVSKKPLRLRP